MNQKFDDERADSTESSEDKMRIELPSGVNIKDIISTFADSKLLAILDLLSKKKMTISQLGENLGLSPQNARHNVETLVDSGLVELRRIEVDENQVEKYYTTTVDLDCLCFMLHELKKTIGVSSEVMSKIKIAILGFAMATVNKMVSIYEKMVDFEKLKFPTLEPSEASFEELYGLRDEDIELKNMMEAKRLRDENDPYVFTSKIIPLWFI